MATPDFTFSGWRYRNDFMGACIENSAKTYRLYHVLDNGGGKNHLCFTVSFIIKFPHDLLRSSVNVRLT